MSPDPFYPDYTEEHFNPQPNPQQEPDECDRARQGATIPPPPTISPRRERAKRVERPPQSIAIQCLLAGDTVAIAAEKATVHRGTLYRWLHDDRDFQDAYFTARADLLAAAQNRLLNMTHSALDSLAAGLSNRRNPWLGYAVLRRLGALSEIHSFDVGGVPTNFLMDLIPPVKHRTILFRPPFGGYIRDPVTGNPVPPRNANPNPI